MKTWLEEFLYETEELESPTSFWKYSALAGISAIVKDNVYLVLGDNTKFYPNIYVMLYAKSGLRKGKPISLVKQLVNEVNNTRMISGRSSIQAILQEMSTAYTLPGGKVVNKSDAFLVASELSSSLVDDKALFDLLTDLYDRQFNEVEWQSRLKIGKFTLKDPTMVALFGTNDAHFKSFLQEKDIQGGFIGRTFIIEESKKRLTNSLIKKLKHPPDNSKLKPHLVELSKLRGKFKDLDETEAGEIYDKWYVESDLIINRLEDKTGTTNRVGDAVYKLSMLLSLSESTDLVIKPRHVSEAITLTEKLVGNVRKATIIQGSKQVHAEQKLLIIEELLARENHAITRDQIMVKYWMHFQPDELNNAIQALSEGGHVVSETIGNKTLYKMPETKVEEWMKIIGGN